MSYIEVSAQDNRFLIVQFLEVFSEIFIPALAILKPKHKSEQFSTECRKANQISPSSQSLADETRSEQSENKETA